MLVEDLPVVVPHHVVRPVGLGDDHEAEALPQRHLFGAPGGCFKVRHSRQVRLGRPQLHLAGDPADVLEAGVGGLPAGVDHRQQLVDPGEAGGRRGSRRLGRARRDRGRGLREAGAGW